MPYYVTYQKPDHEISIGVALREANYIIDLPAVVTSLQETKQLDPTVHIPQDMINLITYSDELQEAIDFAVSHGSEGDMPEVYAADKVELLAPIPRPRKNVFAVGLNYRKHTLEYTGTEDLPKYPIIFTKAPTSVTGPDSPVESYPRYTEQVDYEAELAVVIGKRGKDIRKEEATEYIFGYTIVNDISVRDRQKRTSQWFLGKSMDTHCPMGPYLVDKNEIGWPVELDIKSRVNGEPRQNSNTRLFLFDIPTIIATISEGTTLEPGDVIATGTCEGVGLGFHPPKFLRKSDVVEVEIDKLGVLRNQVV